MTLFTRNNLEKKSGVFYTKPALTGPPNLMEVQPVIHVIRSVTSVLTKSVCMVSGPTWASWALLDLAAGQPDALCPYIALLSPIKRKLTGLLNRMETYVGITCPTAAAYMWPMFLDQVWDLAPIIFWVDKLGFKARFEPVSRAHGLTRLPLLFSEIKAHGCHNLFQQSLSWHVLLYDITQ